MSSEQPWHSWYGKASWQRRRRYQLQLQPLCEMCLKEGSITAALIVDHVEPHRGDPMKFWNGKVQSLCAHCHESRKKFQEQRGFDNTIGIDGMPIDPRHPVYRNP